MAANVGTVNVNLLLGTCKTCRWWGLLGSHTDLPMKACSAPHLTDADDICDHPTHAMIDAEEGSGKLVTGPDFGCIHHEERPA